MLEKKQIQQIFHLINDMMKEKGHMIEPNITDLKELV
jgi:hypothetical protein